MPPEKHRARIKLTALSMLMPWKVRDYSSFEKFYHDQLTGGFI